MKKFVFLVAIAIFGCKSDKAEVPVQPSVATDSVTIIKPDQIEPAKEPPASNERFRDVVATKLSPDSFRVEGKAQVFEATFSWVVEDGHNELAQGFVTTSAGAPQWGTFSFVINVEKDRENSALNLIMFEESAKDGSRQHELFLPLY